MASSSAEGVGPIAAVNIREDAAGTYCLRFSPDGEQLALGCGDGSVELRHPDPARGVKIKFLVGGTGEQLPVTALAYTDNETLTTAGTNGYISVWNCVTGKMLQAFREPGNELYALDYMSDASMFATGGKDKMVRVYDSGTNKAVHSFNEKGAPNDIDHVYSLKFHPERRDLLVGGGWARLVKVWDVRIPAMVREIEGPKICGEGLDIEGDTLLTASWLCDNAVQLWDLRYPNRQPIPVPTPTDNGAYFYAGQFSRPAKLIGVGGSGTKDARLYDRDSFELVGTLPCTSPATKGRKPVQTIDFSADGRYFAMGGSTPTVTVAQLGQRKDGPLLKQGSISEFKLGQPAPAAVRE